MFKKLFWALIIALASSTLYADSNATKTEKPKSASSVNGEAKAAALKLLESMNYKDISDKTVEFYTKRLVSANSKFTKVEGKIKAFYTKYLGWNAVKDDLASLYAKYFTKQEIEDLTKFYQTSTGKKALKTMGKLTYEGQKIIQTNYSNHLNELKSILDSVAPKKTDKNSTKAAKK